MGGYMPGLAKRLNERERSPLVLALLGVGTLCLCFLNVLLLATQLEPEETAADVPEIPASDTSLLFTRASRSVARGTTAQPPPPPAVPLYAIGKPAADIIHVCIAVDSPEPFGLYGVINSTLSHNTQRAPFFFHLVVPPEQHALLAELEVIFPQARFGIFAMAANGVENKVRSRLYALHAGPGAGRSAGSASASSATSTTSKREVAPEVESSLFSWAVIHLPTLFPRLRRLIWLSADALVQRDLLELWQTALGGRPLGAVPDCTVQMERIVNGSLMSSVPALDAPVGCAFDMGVMLIDLVQWAALDITSRIEYWTKQFARTPTEFGNLYNGALDAKVPFLLATQQTFVPLNYTFNFFNLGKSRLTLDEVSVRTKEWAERGVRDSFHGAPSPVRLLDEPAEGRILTFGGPSKPWTGYQSSRCMHAGKLVPCSFMYQPYVSSARRLLRWDDKTAARLVQKRRERHGDV